MTNSVVISGPPAVGKTTLARELAKKLNLQYLGGGDVLKEMAKEEGYEIDGDDWWDRPEGLKFLKQRKGNDEFDKKVDEKLKSLFYKGGIIITSYTLPWLVKGGVKIWLDGSHENSAKRMTKRDNMSSEEAYEITKKRYDENKTLYKKLYNFDYGKDNSVFDIVIDTDDLDANQVIDIATKAVKELL